MVDERSWILGYRGSLKGEETVFKLSLDPLRKQAMFVLPHEDRKEREDCSMEHKKIYMRMLLTVEQVAQKLSPALDLSWVLRYEDNLQDDQDSAVISR